MRVKYFIRLTIEIYLYIYIIYTIYDQSFIHKLDYLSSTLVAIHNR